MKKKKLKAKNHALIGDAIERELEIAALKTAIEMFKHRTRQLEDENRALDLALEEVSEKATGIPGVEGAEFPTLAKCTVATKVIGLVSDLTNPEYDAFRVISVNEDGSDFEVEWSTPFVKAAIDIFGKRVKYELDRTIRKEETENA